MSTASTPPRTAVLVGNPKPQSRTLAAAQLVATELTGAAPDLVVDLAALGPSLLDPAAPALADLVTELSGVDVLVVASPTYKATYTGLLKVFLDRFPPGGLAGVVAVPLMLGAGPGHALAPELTLRPVLVEIGATVPVPGLYVVDARHADLAAYADWLAGSRPVVAALTAARTAAR